MSPTSSVSSMDPDVITNVWMRNVRRKRNRARAMRIDSPHSAAVFAGFAGFAGLDGSASVSRPCCSGTSTMMPDSFFG